MGSGKKTDWTWEQNAPMIPSDCSQTERFAHQPFIMSANPEPAPREGCTQLS